MSVKSILSMAGFFAAAGSIGLYLESNPELIGRIAGLSCRHFFLLVLLSVSALATNGLCLRAFTRTFGIRLSWKVWFGLATVTAMGNYLTPFSGGLLARAAFLRHRYDFPYARFLSMLAANYLIVFAAASFAGIVLTSALAGSQHAPWPVRLFFVTVLAAVLLVAHVPCMTSPRRHFVPKALRQAWEGYIILRGNRVLLGKLIALTFINILAGGLLFFVAFQSVKAPVPLATALLIFLLTSFTLLIQVTPGNVGVQEAVASLASAMFGAGAEQGLIASLAVRAAAVLSAFALGPIFSYVLSKELIGVRETTRSDEGEFPNDRIADQP